MREIKKEVYKRGFVFCPLEPIIDDPIFVSYFSFLSAVYTSLARALLASFRLSHFIMTNFSLAPLPSPLPFLSFSTSNALSDPSDESTSTTPAFPMPLSFLPPSRPAATATSTSTNSAQHDSHHPDSAARLQLHDVLMQQDVITLHCPDLQTHDSLLQVLFYYRQYHHRHHHHQTHQHDHRQRWCSFLATASSPPDLIPLPRQATNDSQQPAPSLVNPAAGLGIGFDPDRRRAVYEIATGRRRGDEPDQRQQQQQQQQ